MAHEQRPPSIGDLTRAAVIEARLRDAGRLVTAARCDEPRMTPELVAAYTQLADLLGTIEGWERFR